MKNCRLRASSPGVPAGTGVGEGRGDWLGLGLGRLGLGLSPAARQRAPGELASRFCVYMYFSN